jgi:hypothetical protein
MVEGGSQETAESVREVLLVECAGRDRGAQQVLYGDPVETS